MTFWFQLLKCEHLLLLLFWIIPNWLRWAPQLRFRLAKSELSFKSLLKPTFIHLLLVWPLSLSPCFQFMWFYYTNYDVLLSTWLLVPSYCLLVFILTVCLCFNSTCTAHCNHVLKSAEQIKHIIMSLLLCLSFWTRTLQMSPWTDKDCWKLF